jgi:hypothetical protein
VREVLTMSFWKDPDFWIVVCVLGILWCIWYGTKGYGHDPKHARTDPEPEPERSPLERTTLLQAPAEDDRRECAGCGDQVQYLSSRDLCDGCEWDEQEAGEPFASMDAVPSHEPGADEVAVAAAVARERLSEPPPVPPVPLAPPGAAPVPFVPSLPFLASPPAAAPLEPLPQMGPRTFSSLPQDFAGRHHKPWTPPKGTGELARLRAALLAWDPANPYQPPPAEPETAAVTDRPVTAGDETREIFLGLARQMNWLTPAEQVALWDREFCTPITVGEPPANLAGASVAGLAEWDLRAPLSLPGGQRPAAEAPKGDAA